MKKAFKAYQVADAKEARNLLAGDGVKKAVIYREGPDYKLAFSVFTKENKGLMRHVISPDTVSELCMDDKYGEQLFRQICQMKKDGNLFYRAGSLENPMYYGRLGPNNTNEDCYNTPLFRDEKYPPGMDLNRYVGRSQGLMRKLEDGVCRDFNKSFNSQYHKHFVGSRYSDYGVGMKDSAKMNILYTFDRNADGSFPDLSKPIQAPISQYEVDRVADVFGIEPVDGVYTKGVSFTPIIALDRLPTGLLSRFLGGHLSKSTVEDRGGLFLSSPYCFNLRSSSGEVRHDVVIDPVKAMSILDTSNVLKTSSKQTIVKGVFQGAMAEYDRKPYPPLMNDTYLYAENEVDALYENKPGVSSVFRDPCIDESSILLSMKAISEKPAAPSGRIRSVYVPSVDVIGDPGHISFSEKSHNHYASMLTKCGYLEKSGKIVDGKVTDALNPSNEDADDFDDDFDVVF